MSALTDFFTSLANKIRSKTGSESTLTPTQMVSAVDDVYDAGYDAGYEDGDTIHTQTYSVTTRNSALDMGEKHEYRYIDSSGVPNSNSGTYTLSWDSDFGTTKDMGENNTYRYISVPAKPTTRNYPSSSAAFSSYVTGAGDWYSKTVAIGTTFNTSKIYFVEMTATVDDYNPLTGVTFSGATVLWSNIFTLKNHKNYCAFIKPTSTTVNMTISTGYPASDRVYSWYFYPYLD